MNVGVIMDMIRADPSIPSNAAAFLTSMNLQNQIQIVRSHQVVIDEQRTVSIAELNG